MDQTKIWDYFQNNPEISHIAFNARSRYEFIAWKINKGTKVLNIGVGTGGLERILDEKGVVVSCLDPNETSIERLRSTLGIGERAKVGFSQAIPFSCSEFDVVVMSEVLEHLDDNVLIATIEEVYRVLKEKGRFIITVPANENLLENRVICPNCGLSFHRWGHIQSFTSSRLEEFLCKQFSDIKIIRCFFGEWRTLNWKGKIGWILKKMLIFFGVHGSGETFFVETIKR